MVGKVLWEKCGFFFFFLEREVGLHNILILWQKEADIAIPRLELNEFMIKHEPFRRRL